MGYSILLRRYTAVPAFVLAIFANVAVALENPCNKQSDIRVQDARLLIVPNAEGTQAQLTLSGHALIADTAKTAFLPAEALCLATLGEKFLINRIEVCHAFSTLSGTDSVKPDGNAIEFTLSKSVVQKGQGFQIEQHAGDSICAYHLVVEVHAGANRRFSAIYSIPKSLNGDRAEFEIAPGVRPSDLDIRLWIDRTVGTHADSRSLNAPKSWEEPIKGIRLQSITHAILLSMLVALMLLFFERRHPFKTKFGSVVTWLRAPVTAAMAFYTAGALMASVSNAVFVLLRPRPGDDAPADTIVDALRDGLTGALGGFVFGDLYASAELFILAAIMVALLVLYLLLFLPCRALGAVGRVIMFPVRVLFFAALISATGVVFAIFVLHTENTLPWPGFEAPALIISLLYALIGVAALRRLFDLPKSWVLGAALVVALTALFPTDAVVRSSAIASIGDNVRIWASFLCSSTADFIYVAALTGFAFRIARSDDLDGRLVAAWLIFLLILLVAGFSIGNPTNTVAVVGVLLIALHWLRVPPENQSAERAAAHSKIDWKAMEGGFPFIVGGVAAFIFLIQFALVARGDDLYGRFPLLGLANVPRTFALGAVAALVLARNGPCLRGDSATLKAASISLMILIASMAASLATLKGNLTPVLTGNFGVVASLIICALIVYDLHGVSAGDGHFELRNLFSGTSLAKGIPFISAMAVAVFSAIGPIFMHELTNSVETLLSTSLTRAQQTEDLRPKTQPSPTVGPTTANDSSH